MGDQMNGQLAIAAPYSRVTDDAAASMLVRVVGSDPLSREGVVRYLQEFSELRVGTDDSAGIAEVVIVVVDRIGDATIRLIGSIYEGLWPRIILLAGHLDPGRTAEAMRAGAVGIAWRKDITGSGLRQMIRSVVSGEAVMPPDVLATIVGPANAANSGAARLSVVGLNDREVKVLRLLSDGSDTREIAIRLRYSERTVKTIIQDITHRFGLRNRSHAVAYALRHNLI